MKRRTYAKCIEWHCERNEVLRGRSLAMLAVRALVKEFTSSTIT